MKAPTMPANMAGPFLLALGAAVSLGQPAPTNFEMYGPGELSGCAFAITGVSSVLAVHSWARYLDVEPQVTILENRVRAVATGPFAGVELDVSGSSIIDDQVAIDARDRAADIRDLAAAVAAGEIAECVR